jgi:hypothetical protein
MCRFIVRNSHGIKTHTLCSVQAFICLDLMRSEKLISNWYELQRDLFTKVLREYILENLTSTSAARRNGALILSMDKFYNHLFTLIAKFRTEIV